MRKQMIENKYPGPALYSEVFSWLVKKYRLNRGANLLFQPDSLLMEIQGLNVAKLQSILEELEQPGLIKLVTRKIQSSDQQMELVVLKPRVMFLSRYINFGKLQKQYQLGISRLKSIALLCTNDKCRMQYIMYYFGEKIQSCRQCDYCRLKHMNK